MSASASAARTSASSADLLAENAELKAQIAALTAKYERSAAQVVEQNGIVMALQARNDNLERAVRIADDSRNSLGVVLSYLDRVVPLNVDVSHVPIWKKLRADANTVAHQAKLTRDAEEYERIAQQGPPERILGAPVPAYGQVGTFGGDATPQIPRGEALVDPHPPANKKAKTGANRPKGIIGAKAVYLKTHIAKFREEHPDAGRDLLNLIGKAYDALPEADKEPYRTAAAAQSEANAALRSEGKPTKSAEGLVLAVDEDGEASMAVDEDDAPTTPQRALPAPAENEGEGEADTEDEPEPPPPPAKKSGRKAKRGRPAPDADAASSDEENA